MIKSLIFSAFLLLFSFSLSAQVDQTWKEANDHGDYYEGAYIQKAGYPVFDVVSFFAGRERFTSAQWDSLKVAYYVPEKGPCVVKMEEINPLGYYWLESKSEVQKKGWAEFTRSGEDSTIFIRKVPYGNLAVLAYWGEPGLKQLLPVFTYHSMKPQFSQYLAHVRTSVDLSGGSYTLYKGLFQENTYPEEDKVFSGRVGEIRKDTFVPVSFPTSRLIGHEGWVTVHLQAKTKAGKEVEYVFYFYHHFE